MKKIYLYAVLLVPIIFLTGCSASGTDSEVSLSRQAETPVDGIITQAGSYTFSGNVDPIVVMASKDDDVEIVLDSVVITSDVSAPIYVQEAKNVTIRLAEGSVNTVIDNRDTEQDVDDFPNAAIYSMSDLIVAGEVGSSLVVEGNLNDGITSKDDVIIEGAAISVTAIDDGIRGKDSINVDQSNITIEAGGDGLKSDNATDEERGVILLEGSEVVISAGDDGIDAVQKIDFISGTTTITESYEGVEALHIIMREGELNITASDDGINVANTDEEKVAQTGGQGFKGPGEGDIVIDGEVEILGGVTTIYSEGDGFDSNGNAIMRGGTLIVHGPVIDREGPIDVNGTFEITGGTLFAIGAANMAEVPDEMSSQYLLQINFEEMQKAGTRIVVSNSDGDEIGVLVSEKSFNSVTFSSPDLNLGDSYVLSFDGVTFQEISLSSSVSVFGGELKRDDAGQNRRGGGREGGSGLSQGVGSPGGEMRVPRDIDLPDNWESMNDDEKILYIEENRPVRQENL